MTLPQIDRWLPRPLRVLSSGLPFLVIWTGLFLLAAWAVCWYTPLSARATLSEGSEILRLSPDGRLLATRQEGEVTLWDVATGRAAVRLTDTDGKGLTDLSRWPVWAFTFSADGHWLAGDGEGMLKLWELPTGTERVAVQVSADKNFRSRHSFSADGKWLVFRSEGPDQVRIWDLAKVRERAALPGRAGPFRFSPDSKTLAFETRETAPGDPPLGRIRLWDADTGTEKPSFEYEAAPPRRLAFSPDGRILATGERKRSKWEGHYEVKLWDLDSGKARGPWTLPRGVMGLRFIAGGSRLLVTSLDKVWELSLIDPAAAPGEVTPKHLDNSLSISLSADGRLLARSPNQPDAPATIVELPELRERAQLLPFRSGERLELRDFTRDGKLLAVMGEWRDRLPSRRGRQIRPRKTSPPPETTEVSDLLEGELHLYETDTGHRHGTVPVVRSAPVWFAPDGSTLVVLAPEGTPTIWDLPLRPPWRSILVWWVVLAGCFSAGLWLRGRRQQAPPQIRSAAVPEVHRASASP